MGVHYALIYGAPKFTTVYVYLVKWPSVAPNFASIYIIIQDLHE